MSWQGDRADLLDLLEAIANDTIDDAGWARLEEVLLAHPDARVMYRRYVNAHIGLKQYLTARTDEPTPPPKTSSPFELLGGTLWKMADFCWRPTSFSLFVAVGLPLFCIVLLVVQFRNPRVVHPRPIMTESVCVARLGRTIDCVWEQESAPLVEGTPLMIGRGLELKQGLAEIIMANGTTVLLEGPASLLVNSDRLVSLDAGKLTARVDKQSRGFTVRAAGLEIVDIGTEFGVNVGDRRNAAEVEVFQGEIELASADPRNRQTTVHRRVVAGHAVHVESPDRKGRVLVKDIPLVANRFVRRMPIRQEPPAEAILAGFSGGAGELDIDQFPGIAGSGWTSGWEIIRTGHVDAAVSIAGDNPLGADEYIRIVASGTPGTDLFRASLVRSLDLAGPVDLKRPHIVSFDIRIDKMSRLDHARDGITLCNNSKHARELTKDTSGGWHIRLSNAEPKQPTVKHWTFTAGNGKGRSHGIDSRIVAREGSVYSFRVVVDPQSRTWTPSIAVDGGRAVEFAPMNMRSAGTAEERGYWPYLHFRCEMQGTNDRETRKTIGFSLDSIQIVPVENRPEP